MSIQVTDLIHSSFRLIGAIAAGETLETAELNDAFISLNQMLSSWNTEGASLVGRQRQIVAVGGTNGPFALPAQPVRIEAASCSISGVDSGLEIVDAAGWEAIPTPEKAMQSIFIRKLYCDYQFPNSSVYIWPTPRLSGQLELWTYVTIPQFATVTDTINLPPGYEVALRYNFAIAILPEYPRSQVDPTLPAQAQNYKASIVQLNNQNHARTAQPAAATLAAQGPS
jgi:hypothetical protein